MSACIIWGQIEGTTSSQQLWASNCDTSLNNYNKQVGVVSQKLYNTYYISVCETISIIGHKNSVNTNNPCEKWTICSFILKSGFTVHASRCQLTERNVLSMNVLIYDMCAKFNVYYLDIFHAFLDRFGNRNSSCSPVLTKQKGPMVFTPIKKDWVFLLVSIYS